MKSFFIISFLFLLCAISSNGQTNANIPGPENVLVVYNLNSDTSFFIANYYQNARNIPESNIVGLSLPRKPINVGDWSDPHVVKLGYSDEYIQDSTWAMWDSTHCIDTAKFHAWQYFLEEVANPIRLHLQQNNLTSTIRYIVMCRGVPFKIQAAADWSIPGNISLDGLLCMLNTDNYDNFVKAIFNEYTTSCYFNSCDPKASECYGRPLISNPYFDKDPNYEMNARFLPDYYDSSLTLGNYNWNYKLSYLVSRLDGLTYEIITDIIDRSANADKTGNKTWILDGGGIGEVDITSAYNKLNNLGFSTEYNNDKNDWIVTSQDSVMGYTSAGVHQGMPPTYIQDTLDFNYANGAVFNTYESFNGFSIGNLRRAGQGLMTEFLFKGGTGGAGHSWEPGTGDVIADFIYFPYYAIGYNQIDAAWQGMSHLAWRNVLVGDPLTRIYECENTVISSNTTISSSTYSCDVTVPPNVTLKIEAGSVVNFKRTARLKIYGTLEIEENAILNFDNYSGLIVESNGSFIQKAHSELNFYKKAQYNSEIAVAISNGQNLIFNDESEFIVNGLTMNLNSSISFNNNAKLIVSKEMIINPGSELNFLNSSKMDVFGSFICLGETSNKILFNCSDESRLHITNGVVINVQHTVFNNQGIHCLLISDKIEPESLNITDCIFNNAAPSIGISLNGISYLTTPLISNCTINSSKEKTAIALTQVPEINILDNTITLLNPTAIGIILTNNGLIDISDCVINGGAVGIMVGSEQEGIVIQENLLCNLKIENCVFETRTGIQIANNSLCNSVLINGNHFQNCIIGISVNNFTKFTPVLTNNIITGRTTMFEPTPQFGVILTNGNEALISGNSITSFKTGISLTNINMPFIKENLIFGGVQTETINSGIAAVSSNGVIRKNIIQNHYYGIELGSSSPKIAANTITDNLSYGIYISDNSNPDLSGSLIGTKKYPLSGFNTIRENGKCDEIQNSELFLFSSFVKLEKGCNTIADDRNDGTGHCNYLYLINGEKMPEIIIKARGNYWGNHPVYGNDPTGRFGQQIAIDYSDFLNEPCTYSDGEEELILFSSKGEVYDTVYSIGDTPSGLTDIESRYAAANSYYYNNQYNQAKQEYEAIIQNYGDDKESLQAYNRLLTIVSLMNNSPASFNQLKEFYLQQSENQTDSLMIGTLTHLSNLCLISAEEYLTAINNFDEEAQQNPNTDIALYRQIDALTTSLLIPQDSTLNKGLLGKYSVTGLTDYTNKLSELLKTRGKSGLGAGEEILPTEFTLHQNYPNPFNPVTTIKYDIPDVGTGLALSKVSLKVYDILGREIVTLVNTKQEAGRYEVQFNASNLASGIYIYQLITDSYVNTKKMLLLK